ncbi:hypothetical protein Ciccas_014636, partial [Cichlidogyrus casuarinus]
MEADCGTNPNVYVWRPRLCNDPSIKMEPLYAGRTILLESADEEAKLTDEGSNSSSSDSEEDTDGQLVDNCDSQMLTCQFTDPNNA